MSSIPLSHWIRDIDSRSTDQEVPNSIHEMIERLDSDDYDALLVLLTSAYASNVVIRTADCVLSSAFERIYRSVIEIGESMENHRV